MRASDAETRERFGAASLAPPDAVYRYAAAGVVPDCVLEPHGIDEVVEAVRAARAAGLALVPAGRGTHLAIGWPPRRYDAALSTRRLTRLIAHDAGDMTVTAEAGLPLGALAETLARAGQWLPLDPAGGETTTVGGVIAADRCGPLRFAHGKVRDWLIGLKVVSAAGDVVRGGGRVVKNVAGYDLPKLFTGSFGTVGVIVEATFKVRPLPAQEALFVWPAPSLAEALSRALSILGSPVLPVLLEVVNEAAGESLGLDSAACLVVGCAGSAAHLDEQERRLGERSGADVQRLSDDRARALRRALSDFSQPANEDGVVARLSALPTELAALLPEVERAAAERQVVAEIAMHGGSGVAWCQLLGAADPQTLVEMTAWLRRATRARGGWAVFEALPPDLIGRVDPWGFDAASVRLMRGVKAALDPTDVFSPGRFVGGI
jgi:glycolate oxidase FAD binding subunit